MGRSNARRVWQNVIAGAVFTTLSIVPVVQASFFFNNLIPPPTGTSPKKEVDPPPVTHKCKHTCPTPPPVHQAPEPATIVLAMLGVAGAGAYRRLGKKA